MYHLLVVAQHAHALLDTRLIHSLVPLQRNGCGRHQCPNTQYVQKQQKQPGWYSDDGCADTAIAAAASTATATTVASLACGLAVDLIRPPGAQFKIT